MEEQFENAKQRKKRGPNYTNQEKITLTNVVNKYKRVIENKKTDLVTQKQKNKVWDIICQEFNSAGKSPSHRSTSQLKVLWENLKRATRKHLSNLRQETFKTGGGRNEVKEDALCIQIQGIIGNSGKPLDNDYDSDVFPAERYGGYNESNTSQEVLEERDEGEMLPETEESFDIKMINSVQSDEILMIDEILESTARPLTAVNVCNAAASTPKRGLPAPKPGMSSTAHGIEDWTQWSPKLLQTRKSPALQISQEEIDISANTKEGKEEAKLQESILKRISRKPYVKTRTVHERSKNFDCLMEAKLDYIEMVKKETSKKLEMEQNLLTKKIIREDLEIQLLRQKLDLPSSDQEN